MFKNQCKVYQRYILLFSFYTKQQYWHQSWFLWKLLVSKYMCSLHYWDIKSNNKFFKGFYNHKLFMKPSQAPGRQMGLTLFSWISVWISWEYLYALLWWRILPPRIFPQGRKPLQDYQNHNSWWFWICHTFWE